MHLEKKAKKGAEHMCGIIAYTGTQQAVPVILDGLKRLEYRGYDSAGIAYPDNGNLEVVKSSG